MQRIKLISLSLVIFLICSLILYMPDAKGYNGINTYINTEELYVYSSGEYRVCSDLNGGYIHVLRFTDPVRRDIEYSADVVELINPPHGLSVNRLERYVNGIYIIFNEYEEGTGADSCTDEHTDFGFRISGSLYGSGTDFALENILIRSNNYLESNTPIVTLSSDLVNGAESGTVRMSVQNATLIREEAEKISSYSFRQLSKYGYKIDNVTVVDGHNVDIGIIKLNDDYVKKYPDLDVDLPFVIENSRYTINIWFSYILDTIVDEYPVIIEETPLITAIDDDESMAVVSTDVLLNHEDGAKIVLRIEDGEFQEEDIEGSKTVAFKNEWKEGYLYESVKEETNGLFSKGIGYANWTLIGAPVGVSIDKVEYSDKQNSIFTEYTTYSTATITLKGNSTVNKPYMLKIRCPYNKYTDYRTQKSVPEVSFIEANEGDGSTFDYSLVAEMQVRVPLGINGMDVNGGTLVPAFDPGIYEYEFTATKGEVINFIPQTYMDTDEILFDGDIEYDYEDLDNDGNKIVKSVRVTGPNFTITIRDNINNTEKTYIIKMANWDEYMTSTVVTRKSGVIASGGGGASQPPKLTTSLPNVLKLGEEYWIYKYFTKISNGKEISSWAYDITFSNPDVLEKKGDTIVAKSEGACDIIITDTATKRQVTVSVVVGGKPAQNASVAFADIPTHWAKEYIEKVARLDLMQGVGDNRFDPEGTVIFEEIVTVLDRYLVERNTLPYVAKTTPAIVTSDWSEAYVRDFLGRVDIDKLDNMTDFTKPVKREQVAYLLAISLYPNEELQNVSAGDTGYVDNMFISDKFAPYIVLLKDKGIMQGNEKNAFDGQATLTRAEMAALLSRIDSGV